MKRFLLVATVSMLSTAATGASAASAPSISISPTSESCVEGTMIVPVVPVLSPDVVSIGISPDIVSKTGLSFNSTTGAITGTPTSAKSSLYTLTALNAAGKKATASVTIIVNDVSPTICLPASPGSSVCGASSASAPFHFLVGAKIEDIVPILGPSTTSVAISPDITTTGLSFNVHTGRISGTPTSSEIETSYTLVASNATGQTASTVLYMGLTNVVAATAPPPSPNPGCEYTLSIADFQSTNLGVLTQQVYAGGVPVAMGADGYYHVPLTDSSYNVIVDSNDPSTVPWGVWEVQRSAASFIAGNSGHQNDGGLSGYVSYNVAATLNCPLVRVTNVKGSNGFEDEADGISITGDAADDQYTVSGNTIFAESSTTTAADLYSAIFAVPNVCSDVSLTYAGSYPVPVGSDPVGLVVGDLNNDGMPDVVSADYFGGLSTFLLQADGTFVLKGTYPAVSGGTNSVSLADFNGDGILDAVVAEYTSNAVAVLYGVGDGSFAAATQIATNGDTGSATAGDINGDGRPDILASNGGGGTISVLLQNAAGGFAAPVLYSVVTPGSSQLPGQIVLADLNGDGVTDLVIANDTSLAVLLGTGSGNFGTPAQFPSHTSAGFALAVADLNGDGELDVAMADGAGGQVAILFGNGDGTFGTPTNYVADSGPSGVVVGDMNGDGRPDVATVNQIAGDVTVLINQGDGIFTATNPSLPTDTATPDGIGLVDVNGDGRLDLVVVDEHPGNLNVFDNTCRESCTAPGFDLVATYPAPTASEPVGLVLGDLNNDHRLDVVTADYEGGVSSFLLQSDGSFVLKGTYPALTGGVNSVSLADFNGDGFLDVVVAEYTSNAVAVLYGMGDGSFGPATEVLTNGDTGSATAGDLNGDGRPDIVASNGGGGTISVLLQNLDGTFAQPVVYEVVTPGSSQLPGQVVIADLNADGHVDLAIGNDTSLAILLGDGTGSFGAATQYYSHTSAGWGLVVADLNGDGIPDVAITDGAGGQVAILFGNGDGSFGAPTNYIADYGPSIIVVGDLNDDGKPDLATVNQIAGDITVLINQGAGLFTAYNPPVPADTEDPDSLGLVDLYGNGNLDILVLDEGGGLKVFENTCN